MARFNFYTIYTKGFTLIEVLLSVCITALVVGGTIAIYLMSLAVWKDGSLQMALQREASITVEKMVQGINGMNGITEASTVTRPNTFTIRYTSGIDGRQRSFYLSGSKIMYDPNTSIAGNEFSIAEHVRTSPSGLTFSVSSSLVTINLGLEENFMNKVINVDLSTKVKLRN